jgi:ADP-ribose pyrophosphatase
MPHHHQKHEAAEQVVWNGKFIKVTTENKSGAIWERVYIPSGVVVLPLTADKKIILIRERRPHENPPIRLKPVTGMLDEGLSPLETAHKELQEEIGIKAESIELFWHSKSNGTVNAETSFFIARELSSNKIPNPDGDVIEDILYLTLSELEEKLWSEELRWGVSALGIFKFLKLIKEGKIKI